MKQRNKSKALENYQGLTYDMCLQVIALNELLAAICALIWFVECMNTPKSQKVIKKTSSNELNQPNLHMELVFLLILKRSRAHGALEWILIDVSLDVRLQVVRLCKLLLANLQTFNQNGIIGNSEMSQLTSHL